MSQKIRSGKNLSHLLGVIRSISLISNRFRIFNHESGNAVKAAWAPPPYAPHQAFVVYKAYKEKEERTLLEFTTINKANFTVNSVFLVCISTWIVSQENTSGTSPKTILNETIPPLGEQDRKCSFSISRPFRQHHITHLE